jgi:3-deoxy-D-manno-octulosonic acid (KDO) 8-phosphate synthase
VDGLVLEAQDHPIHALSDHATQLNVATLPDLIRSIVALSASVREFEV